MAPERHIDGVTDVDDISCDYCHGSSGNAAPPLDLSGNTEVSAPGVGAHREHLVDSDWHVDFVCEDCHNEPDTVMEAGHIDETPSAELEFSLRATHEGATTPAYNVDTYVCTDVYCHGADLSDPGASVPEPIWTTGMLVGSCASCHGFPPSGGHPSSLDCRDCHSEVVNLPSDFVNPDLHINGEVDVDPIMARM